MVAAIRAAVVHKFGVKVIGDNFRGFFAVDPGKLDLYAEFVIL
jgi:hypothetical protein